VSFDAIVVGTGAGGASVACVLAEAGKSVLLLERGPAIDAQADARDHARSLGGPIPGPAGGGAHSRRIVLGERDWNMLGAVGGGTLVWGMQAWRFHPDDFRMASRYGVPAGSSLADWPIGYDDLEPWYARAERELGVAGDGSPHAVRSNPFPLEPIARGPTGDWLAAGAERLGWRTFHPPLAVNSRPYNGRAACIGCSECIGFTCPVDAKSGGHNTFIPRALSTGLCVLETDAHATRLATDSGGRVTGVEYVHGRSRRVGRARAVFVAGGAIESARLLLHSTSRHHPQGVGNSGGHVGRHLQGHSYPIAVGILPSDVPNPNRGPRVTVATTEFNHGNEGVVGGAMMADNFVPTPLTFWRTMLPPDVPRWGRERMRAMQELYLRAIDVRAPVQEVPSPENRVTLHARLRDRVGVPVAELSGVVHPETLRTVEFIRGRLLEWLQASGAERVWSAPSHLRGLADWFHQSGTCRMSSDPADGVVDPTGRIHGHDNVFVADGSVHVTNGGFNPALTVFALALRTAENALSTL
jgi:choline dehydrogenase-like flavoprotein